MERLIYSQPNIDYIDLPLEITLPEINLYCFMVPKPSMNNIFITLTENEEEKLNKYFQNILKGKFLIHHQWNILHPHFSSEINRFVVRELSAKALMDYFSKKFNIEIIFLLRHPIPTVLSQIKWGMKNIADTFLNNDFFINKFLDEQKKEFCKEIQKNGSKLEKYILGWCLDNLSPLKIYQERSWLTLTYEELLIKPKKVTNLICTKFDLPDPEIMYQSVYRPSPSAPKKSIIDIKTKGPEWLTIRWMKEIDDKTLEKVNVILETFNISEYNAFSPYPSENLCYFGSLEK